MMYNLAGNMSIENSFRIFVPCTEVVFGRVPYFINATTFCQICLYTCLFLRVEGLFIGRIADGNYCIGGIGQQLFQPLPMLPFLPM